mmetsp:Transcript_10836/g.31422  ORF Transcript_10836/g.31422 Transcript_10836/m.31422 type:complete len:85 (+) Transcript_10836:1237-1491(+)
MIHTADPRVSRSVGSFADAGGGRQSHSHSHTHTHTHTQTCTHKAHTPTHGMQSVIDASTHLSVHTTHTHTQTDRRPHKTDKTHP